MSAERRPTADRQREIADAALRIIARDGLGKFTAAALAAEVGLTNGALFRHFAGMDEIVSAAIDRAEEVLFEQFPHDDSDPLRRLGQFVCARLTAVRQHPDVLRVVYTDELARAGADRSKRVRGFKRRSVAFVRDCLEEAATLGLLKEVLEPKELTLIVVGTIMAAALVPEARERSGSPAARPNSVWATIEQLIRRQPGEPDLCRDRGSQHKEKTS
jgi:AcrR family transcriptional regulator